MEFDFEGHLLITPREFCERLGNANRLINDVLIPGTPLAFETFDSYREFLHECATSFGIHPNNFQIRGSTKLGFSIAPDADSAWREMRPDSDLDLAIVDADYYHYLDCEIRKYERDPNNRAYLGAQFTKSIARRDQRRFYTYRYFDLPPIACVAEQNQRLRDLPVGRCCGCDRPIDAFVYRDWWSLHSRWEFDLRELNKAIRNGLALGGDRPLSNPDEL